MARNAAAKSLLLSTVSKDDEKEKKYNSRTGKLRSEEAYTPKTETAKTAGRSVSKTVKTAEKSAVSSVSGSKNIPNTNLFKGLNVSEPETKKLKASDSGVFKKYTALAKNTTLSYAEKKKQITSAQKELGKIRDRHLIASMLGDKNAKKTIQQVTDLQNQLSQQLKSTAFGAGFGQAAGLDIYDTAVKKAAEKTGNTALSAKMKEQDAAREALKEKNEKSYGAGELAGELTQAAILYGTAGAAAEKAALKGVGKLTGGKTLGKAGTFATRMLGQQTADVAVNTPLTIAKGVEEGKGKGEIAQDVGKQFALDAAFNLGMGAVGAGAKAAGKAIGKVKDNRAAVKTAREAAQREMLEAAAKTPTPTAAQRRKQMLDQEDLPELAKEYQLMQDDRFWSEKIREIGEKYGDDTARATKELEALQTRMEDLEEMLGITTKKVKDAQSRLENTAVRNIRKTMDIFGKADTAEAKELMKKAAREANRGKVSKKTRDEVFEKLFVLGKQSNRENIDKGLKDRLRNLHLTVSETDASGIADFDLWKKGTMGKIGSIKKADKGNIDTTWDELRNDWPEWFPEDMTNPTDQLQRIAEVADEMKYYNIPISETMAEEEKAMLREGFERYMDALEQDTAKLVRFKKDRKDRQLKKLLRQGELTDYSRLNTKDVEYMHDELFQLQRDYDRVERKVNLTAGDKSDLERLLRGELTEAQARERAGVNADDLMAMYEVSLPLHRMKKSLEGYRQYVNGKYTDEVKNLVGEMDMRTEGKDGWKDIALLRQARETQSRIVDMVAPKRIAGKIKEKIFDPIHTSERDRTLFKNEYIKALKETKISTKKNILIRMADGTNGTTSESALVQWLGEMRYKLREMENAKGHATADDLQAELLLRAEIQAVEANLSAEQLKKIDNGIEVITKIYKEIHPKINETLVRNGYAPIGYIEGYFPHMNFDDPKGIGEKAASMLGFDFTSKELPMDIAGRTDTFRPGKKWAGNLLTRKGTQTDYDALRAFDLYIDNISDVIYHTDNIKRLRAYEDYIRYTLSDKGIQEAIDRIKANPNLNELQKLASIEEEYAKNQGHTLQNYVKNIRLYTDILAGKKHNLDRILENEIFGRGVYQAINSIEGKVAGNMVAGNIGSAMTNFIPITQGMSSMSAKSNLQGLKEALQYMSKAEADDLTKKSAFLTTRAGSDLLYKTRTQKVSEAGGKLNPLQWMEVADTFSTQAVWRSRYYDNMAKGMTEDAAIKNADEFARNLFGGRSKGAMPTLMHSKALKPLTMFQLEVNNQMSYLLKDIPKEAQGDVKKMMKAYSGIIIGAYIYNDVYEKITGRRSALDPFGMANEAIGDFTGEKVRNIVDIGLDAAQGKGLKLTEETEKKKPSVALEETMKNVGGNIPFVGSAMFDGGRIPISTLLELSPVEALGTGLDLLQGETTPEKAGRDIYSDLSPALWYGLMPTAGGQMRKTVHGLNTMAKGGRYNQTKEGAELQFAVDKENPAEWVESLLFGQWATKGGREYLEDNGIKLGTNQTATYEKLVAAGMKNTEAFEEISKIRMESKTDGKRSAIRSSGLSEDQKAILFYDMAASDTDKGILDHYQESESMGKVADCLLRMADHSGANAERSVLRYSDLSDADKKYIYLEKISSTEKDQTRITELAKAGMGMDEFLSIRNKYATLDKASMGGKQKKATFLQWMQEQGYSTAQIGKIKENFEFSGGYLVKW